MMKNTLKVVLLTSILPFAASAETELSPWYVGAGLGVNNYEPNCDQKTMKICGEDSPYAWDVFGGYMFSDNFGVELGYRDLGMAEWTDYNNKRNDAGARGMTAGLVAVVPFADGWSVSAEAGAMNYLLRNKKNYNTEYYSDSGIAPYIGAGIGYMVTENMKLQAKYRRYENLDDDAFKTLEMQSNYWGLELSYRFGAKAKPAPVAAAPVVAAAAAPADSDNDGVMDDADRCPNTPANHKVDANGCSIYENVTEQHDLGGILFDNNSSVIKQASYAEIEKLANYLNRNPEHTVSIEGHASNVGSPAYNMTLSEKRAKAVANALSEKYGIDASRVQSVGYGVTRPIMEGSSAEANRQNRRIEAIVTSTEKRPVLK
ncbi:OmpA family protein [Shewanella maritima]|uniref:OmpA family protein n=1 Tax=Shewanella maritima TaxID=2520507 RepID=A0A411PKA4_9GAMM|nr:OmpA family protein [Shewanella maritima]QBF83948.1 OmpA family protein [Shewanella maritima]